MTAEMAIPSSETTNSILKNATDEQPGLAVQENLFALFRAMTALPDSKIEETPKLSRHHTSPTNPMYKGVWGTHLSPNEVESAIHETTHWFKSRGAPFSSQPKWECLSMRGSASA